jgi:hypothetical protein
VGTPLLRRQIGDVEQGRRERDGVQVVLQVVRQRRQPLVGIDRRS